MSQDDTTRETLPDLDGDLILGERLGEGGGGSVHAADQRSLRRKVAVKRLHGLSRGDAEHRFREEATIMGCVAHPNIVPVLMHGRLNGRPVLVMEHVDGLDLAAVLKKLGAAPKPLTADTLRECLNGPALEWPVRTPWWKVGATLVARIARALDHAHRCGVLHRDIKPGNVLLARNGTVLLTDFGVAQWIQGADSSSDSSASQRALSTSGTLAYAAPETLDGQPHSIASDIYSLGVLARELITGQAAYVDGGDGPAARIRAISEGRLSPLGRDLPASVRATLEVATAQNPGQRYASAGDLARDLENAVAGRPILARPEGQVQKVRRWVRRKSDSATAIGILAALVFGVPAVLQTSRLRAATRVSRAADAAHGHLRVVLDGIGDVLLDAATETLGQLPLLNAKRAQLLEAGSVLGQGLAATITDEEQEASTYAGPDSLPRRIHQLREHALRGLVNTQKQTGDLAGAREALNQLIECEAAGVALGDPYRGLELQYFEVTLAHAMGDLEAAAILARTALDSLGPVSDVGDIETKIVLNLRNLLVEAALARDDPAEAVRLGEMATEEAEGWVDRTQGSELARRELCRILGNHVAALIAAGQLDRAEALTGKALGLHSSLPGTPDIQEIEAGLWNSLGGIQTSRGAHAKAEKSEAQALALQQSLLALKPHSVHLRFCTSRSLLRLGNAQLALAQSGQPEKAVQGIRHLDRALGGARGLCNSSDAPWAHLNLRMVAARALAEGHMAARSHSIAQVAFEEALDSARKADAHSPSRATPPAVVQNMWFKRTAIVISKDDSDHLAALASYCAAIPGDALVARNAASMACQRAMSDERSLKGAAPGARDDLRDRVELLESAALGYLEMAAELGGLPRSLLETHPTWERLHDDPRYQALLAGR